MFEPMSNVLKRNMVKRANFWLYAEQRLGHYFFCEAYLCHTFACILQHHVDSALSIGFMNAAADKGTRPFLSEVLCFPAVSYQTVNTCYSTFYCQGR